MKASQLFFGAAALLGSLCTGNALAERADRDKPVNIESDTLKVDEEKDLAIFEGRVVMTQGSFILRSNTLTVRKDAQGFQHATALGKPATFREKRDGSDEWIDGEALRVEYDSKREFLELFETARLTRGKDEVRGSYISYDIRADYYTVQSNKGQGSNMPPERVRATLQPKKKDDPATAPIELRPAPRIEGTK